MQGFSTTVASPRTKCRNRPFWRPDSVVKGQVLASECAVLCLEAKRHRLWYNVAMNESVPTSVLDRVLDPFTDCLTPEVAQRIVQLRADPDTQAHLDQLADKANEGQLSATEQAEYDKFREAFHFITILQAKARTLLERQPAS